MTRHAWIGAAALCLILAACNGPAQPAASTPSADSFRAEPFEVRVGEAIEKVNGATVTNAFFREAKIQPMLGRMFLDEEYQVAGAPAVVIAASLWQRQFGGDPALIGRTLSVNQRQCTIVGILPKTFQFPTGAELWMPQNR
jgi:putative ABC transport system permease protein